MHKIYLILLFEFMFYSCFFSHFQTQKQNILYFSYINNTIYCILSFTTLVYIIMHSIYYFLKKYRWMEVEEHCGKWWRGNNGTKKSGLRYYTIRIIYFHPFYYAILLNPVFGKALSFYI